MGKFTCKNPAGVPTRKQTFAVFCLTGNDIRDIDLTRQEVSDMIGDLKSKGDHTLPTGKKFTDKHGDESNFICSKKALRETANKLWEESGTSNPMSVGAVVKKTRPSKTIAGTWALKLIKAAEAAGKKALDELVASGKVVPMVVQQHENMMDDNSPVAEQWVVPGGPCGFASIRVKCVDAPSRKFVNQLKKAGVAGDRNSHCDWSKSDYYGGYMKSFSGIGGQSMIYKETYAHAYARVLDEAGIDTWVWSRMD